MSVCVSQMWIWRPRGAEAAAAAAAAASSYILEHSPCPPVQIPSHSRGLRRIHLEDSSAGPRRRCGGRFSCSPAPALLLLLSLLPPVGFVGFFLLRRFFFVLASSLSTPFFFLLRRFIFVLSFSHSTSFVFYLSFSSFLLRFVFLSTCVCVIFFFCRFLFMFSLLTHFSSPFLLTDGGESGSSVTYFIHNCLFINFFIVYHLSRYYFTNVFTL